MAFKKITLSQIFSFLLLLAVLVVSLVFFILNNSGVRRVFLFESFNDDRVYIESRTMPRSKVYAEIDEDGNVSEDLVYRQYVEELISGTVTDRYRPLFSPATHVLSCMLRDGKLYVNLSEDALLATASSSSTEKACELLQKNILTNFTSVRKVYVFINGLPVYQEVERGY